MMTGEVQLTAGLRARGIDDQRVRSLRRSGRVHRIRRGAVSWTRATTPEDCHRLLVEGTWPQIHPGGVVSHWSAAVMHGLWLHRPRLDQVWITREGHTGGQVRQWVHMVHCPMKDWEIVEVDGTKCTSLARTAMDIARHDGFVAGVVVADHAMRLGVTRQELFDVVKAARRRPGNATARRVAAFADKRPESPKESELRALMDQLGLPHGEPQYEIVTPDGEFVARVDLALEECMLVIEFDGEEKYHAADGPEALLEVLAQEKAREQAILAQGWWILRLRKADLRQPKVLAARIRQAMAVARRRMADAA